MPAEEDYLYFHEPAAGQPANPVLPAAFVSKLREGAFKGRRKEIDQ